MLLVFDYRSTSIRFQTSRKCWYLLWGQQSQMVQQDLALQQDPV